jgi:YesN/AraC family two-component response regulator
MNAIKMGAIDYILKPATKVTLENAINKAKVQVDQKIRMEQMSMMLQTYYKGSPAQRIALPNSEGLRFRKTGRNSLLQSRRQLHQLSPAQQ